MFGIVIFLFLGFIFHSFIGTFVFGIFIYYATRPLYRRLEALIHSRTVAAGISVIAFVLPVVLLLAYTIAVGLQELSFIISDLDSKTLETYIGPFLYFSEIVENPQDLFTSGNVDILRSILREGTVYVSLLATAVIHLFLILSLAFYLLRDDHRLSSWADSRLPVELKQYLGAVDRSFHSVFFGNILNAAITTIIAAVCYNALAFWSPIGLTLPYPTLMALLTGIGSLVPIVGMKIVYIPVTAYMGAVVYLADSPELAWFPVLFFAISLILIDGIPDIVLRPYVTGKSLHTGTLMVAYILGPLLFSWYGLFLGPMILVVIVQFSRYLLPELLSDNKRGYLFGVDPVYIPDNSCEGSKDDDTSDSD